MAASRKEEYEKFLELKEDFTLVFVDQSFVEKKLVELEKLFETTYKLISEASQHTPKAPQSVKELDALIAEDKRKFEHKEPSHNILDFQGLIADNFEKILRIRYELLTFKGNLKQENKDDIETMVDLIKSINANLKKFNPFLLEPLEDNVLNITSTKKIAAETKKISEPQKQSAVVRPPNRSGLSIALKPELLDVRHDIQDRLKHFERVLDENLDFEKSAKAVTCSTYISQVLDELREAMDPKAGKSTAELEILRDQTNALINSYIDFITLAQVAMEGINKDKTKLIDHLKSELTAAINTGYDKIMAGQGAAAYVELYERVSQLCKNEVARTVGWKTTDVNPSCQSLQTVLIVQAGNFKLYGGLEEDLKKSRRFDA